MLSTYIPVALAGLAGLANAATNDEWAQRSIYQVITDRYARANGSDDCDDIMKYCGGTWAGIVSQLDYIQGMGFTAIQISPAQKNIDNYTIYGEAYHGYWIQDFYSLNDNFGTADDLKNLSSELHARDMYLLVDVVANEVAWDLGDSNLTSSTYIDYELYNPFNSAEYFHPYCSISDWSNMTEVTDCWLGTTGVATPDLKTENSTVADMLNTWITEFVSNYSIDGIRLDGAKQTNTGFFEPFISAAGVYAMAEVDDGDASTVCGYQNYTGGLENYPLYYTIIRAFTAGEMGDLVSMAANVSSACSKTQYLANFIENQDNERFASYTEDMALAKNAIAYTILSDGIPKMYYGQEQHLTGNYSPYNRQPLWPYTDYTTPTALYNLTGTLNKLRNHAININSNYVSNTTTLLYTDDSTLAQRKGPDGVQIVSVFSNQGATGGSYELSIGGAGDVGLNMTEVMNCTTVVTGKNGTIVVDMAAGQPRVFFPTFNLNGSGICGNTQDSTSTTVSGNSSSTSSGSSSSSTSTKKGAAAEGLRVSGALVMGMVALAGAVML